MFGLELTLMRYFYERERYRRLAAQACSAAERAEETQADRELSGIYTRAGRKAPPKAPATKPSRVARGG